MGDKDALNHAIVAHLLDPFNSMYLYVLAYVLLRLGYALHTVELARRVEQNFLR